MIEVEGPGGVVIEFPDDTPPDVIKAAMQKRFGAPKQPEAQATEPEAQGKVSGAFDAFTQGASFGFGDELTGLESAVLGRTPEGGLFDYSRPFGERYDRAVAAEREQQGRFSEENPEIAIPAEIAGAFATGVGAARTGATIIGRGATRGARIAAGGAEGAAYGGLYGAGEADEGDRLAGAQSGAVLGGVAGGALTGAGDAVARALSRRAAVKAAPTSADLMRQGGGILEAAKQRNAAFGGFDDYAMNIYQRLGDEGIDPKLHPNMARWLDGLEELTTGGTAPTYRQLDILRKRLGPSLGNMNNPSEQRMAMIARQALDDFMMAQGDDAVRQGRELYRRGKNTHRIEQAVQRAEDRAASTYAGGNLENAQRQQLRRLLDSDKLRRGFKPDEQDAIRQTLRGSGTQNVARALGKLSPARGGVMANLSMLQAGAAGMTGNPLLLAPAAVGAVAKPISDRAFQNSVRELAARIASGGPVNIKNATPEQLAIARALAGLIGGSTAAP